LALIVACDQYDHAGLGRLRAPAHDAVALADVLGDPAVGDFEVLVVHNKKAQAVRRAVESFLVDSKVDDLLLLHFSCHGVKNADGELFLAMRDTDPNLLASTGVAASFVNQMVSASRSQRIALFLDCCYGGAFPRGMVVRASEHAAVRDAFADSLEVSDGRGRVVVTASEAMQYSFEAGELTEYDERPSVFTGAVVEGLSSGEADRDQDGWVSINELFGYVTDKVRSLSRNQRPQMWTFGAQGDILLARSRKRRGVATPLDPELAQALTSPLAATRYGLVDLLRERLLGSDLGLALAAWQALSSLAGDDSRRVVDAVFDALSAARLQVSPATLELTLDDTGTASGDVELDGPPLALVVEARSATPWLRVVYVDDRRLRLVASAPADPGVNDGVVTLHSPSGQREVVVRLTVATRSDDVHGATAPTPELGPGRRPGLRWPLRTRTAAFVGAGALLAAAGGVSWLFLGREDAKLPTGPVLPDSAVFWVSEEDDQWAIELGNEGETPSTIVHGPPRSINWPILSADRRTVIYQALTYNDDGSVDQKTLRVVGTDGTGDASFELGSKCPRPGRPAVSAAGIAVVCSDDEGGDLPGIRIFDRLGHYLRTVDGSHQDGNPTWAEDGDYVLFWRQSSDPASQHLYAIAANQTEPEVRLTRESGWCDSLPAISPDGDRVVFFRRAPSTASTCADPGYVPGQLYTVKLDAAILTGSQQARPPQRLVVEGSPYQPGWASEEQVMYTEYKSGKALVVTPGGEAAPFGVTGGRSAHMLFAADR